MKRLIALVTVTGMTLLGLVAVTGPVLGKVSGPNGRLVFSVSNVPLTSNPDGSHVQQLFGEGGIPHWSPDGTKVAFGGPGDGDGGSVAHIVDVDTGSIRLVPTPDPSAFILCVIWSPDGRRLACGVENDDTPSRNGVYTVRSSDGGGLRRVTSGNDLPGDYSPDGKRIVFLRDNPTRPANASHAFFVVNLDGSGLRRITPWGLVGEAEGPVGSWSPDGTKILFGSRGGNLYTVHPDGSGLTQIPIDTGGGFSFASQPVWSPNGQKMVFGLFLSSTGHGNIYTSRTDGTQLRQVTNSGDVNAPDWGTHPPST
jgi:TolB protein